MSLQSDHINDFVTKHSKFEAEIRKIFSKQFNFDNIPIQPDLTRENITILRGGDFL